MTQYELTADGSGVTALVSCTETVDEQANSSTLAITLEIKSRYWVGATYWLEGTVGDETLDKTADYVYLGTMNKYFPVERTFYMTVPHQADGSGTAALTVNIKGTTRNGALGSGWRIQSTVSVPLTAIARSSVVAATDADIGAVSMIAVSRKNNSYTHTLSYSFGSLTGFIAQDGSVTDQPDYFTAATVGFWVPESFYYELTDGPSAVCQLTCTTYNGTETVGVPAVCGFTVTAPQSKCGPVLTAGVEDVNPDTLALTGDGAVMVRFCSHVQTTVQAQGRYGAAILEQSLDSTVYGPEANEFSFFARDSRGYEESLTITMPMVPYVLLTANLSCSRSGSTATTATLTVRGSCYGGSFGLKDNSLVLKAKTGGREYVLEPVFAGDQYYAQCVLEDLDYTVSHTITVEAADLLSVTTAQIKLQQGVPVFDWGKRDFAFHVPITAPVINGVTNPAFKAWPVGAVMMTAQDQSPADSVGGKWEKLQSTGLDLYLWKRLRTADYLGTAILGTMLLGEE